MRFVFGRTRTEKRVSADGKVITSTPMLPREQWAVPICDHHPGYISWETYEATQRLRANWRAAFAAVKPIAEFSTRAVNTRP